MHIDFDLLSGRSGDERDGLAVDVGGFGEAADLRKGPGSWSHCTIHQPPERRAVAV